MTPIQLAAKMIFDPKMFVVSLLDYLESQKKAQQTDEFRSNVISTLRGIRDLYDSAQAEKISTTGQSDTKSVTRPNSTSLEGISPLDAIGQLQFSTQGLTRLLDVGGPLTVNTVVIALLNPEKLCRVPLELAEMKFMKVGYLEGNVHMDFEGIEGKFWKNENESSGRLSNALTVPSNFRGTYHGALTVKSYSKDVMLKATIRRNLTISSEPVLSLRHCPMIYVSFSREQKLLRELILIKHSQ